MTALSNVADYAFVRRLAEGVVGLASSHGQQLFTLNKLRKRTECAVCKGTLLPKDHAYSPITNGYNRMHRICAPCVNDLEHPK